MQTEESTTQEEEITIYTFPEPATPEEGAKFIDWRFQSFTLELQEILRDQKQFTYGETYSHVEIIDHTKPKGKANKNALVFFAMPIL
jgi:hypothetical protein